MNLVLINPSLDVKTREGLGPIAGNLFYNSPPLGLCYLASYLEERGHSVKIIDAALFGLSPEETLEQTLSLSPDIVGITTFTVSMRSAYSLARGIKRISRQIKTVIGGPHITANPGEINSHPEVDIAVIGEGEITFAELVAAIEQNAPLSGIPGLAYSRDQKLVLTPKREFIQNLDILPLPDRTLVPIKLYRPQPNDQNRLPKLSMITSRGCPYQCIFCDKNVFQNRYRSFSPAYIVNEMRHLKQEYNARDIAFLDSTFTPNKNRVLELVSRIKEADLGITWTCSARADVLDYDLLKAMKEAGCWRVRLGVESGDEGVLKFIRKGVTLDQVRQVAQWADELDLSPKAFFMIGHLTDTKETIEKTIRFACSLPLKDVTVQINTPLPNTAQYALAPNYGKIVSQDAGDYTFFEPVFTPSGITRQELARFYSKFYLRFYLRPVIWYRHIRKISSLDDLRKYFKGLRIIFFFLTSWIKDKFSRRQSQ